MHLYNSESIEFLKKIFLINNFSKSGGGATYRQIIKIKKIFQNMIFCVLYDSDSKKFLRKEFWSKIFLSLGCVCLWGGGFYGHKNVSFQKINNIFFCELNNSESISFVKNFLSKNFVWSVVDYPPQGLSGWYTNPVTITSRGAHPHHDQPRVNE